MNTILKLEVRIEEKKIFIGKPEPFDGLHGVFSDSLPDGWGRLLLDRLFRREQKDNIVRKMRT